ncbi:MAG: DUF4168 domain-containing protein [Bacteroidetes bacterium]|nr:MAG: DUF4168 domain-containing protein [Bacteroidota bacterium]
MFTKKAFFKKFFILSVFIFAASGIMAQMAPQTQELPSDYSDKELEKFASAVTHVMTIQEEGQMQMMSVIEENEITVDRFNEMLMQGQQQGQENIEATEEELLAFTNAMNEVQTLQMQMQEQMMEAITEEGLNVEQYQNIMQSYEVNPEIKERVDNLFNDVQ